MRSVGTRIAICVVVVLSASSCGLLGGNVNDLAVGDCFDVPAGDSGIVSDVEKHPCTDAHDAEVVFVGDYEPATDAYPSESELTDFATEKCIAAFNTFSGLDYNTDELYAIGTLEPTRDGWEAGDHEITCYLNRLDGTKLTSSLKKT